jgi:hypothetical protein
MSTGDFRIMGTKNGQIEKGKASTFNKLRF